MNECQKMTLQPSKTPISMLQELCTKRGLTPKYDVVAVEGAVHEPTFVYRVQVGDMVSQASGSSKKKAKHAAAQNMLDKISGVPESYPVGQIKTESTNSISESNGEHEDGIPGNPVGQLQELTMCRHWPPPRYDLVQEIGQPHEREFIILCKVLKWNELGRGHSKKLAKRQAAHKMMEQLKTIPPDQKVEDLGEEELLPLIDNLKALGFESKEGWYEALKQNKIPTLTPQHSKEVSQFHKKLKASSGARLSELQNKLLDQPGINYCQILQEIALEQNFEVTYVDVEEKNIHGQHQCLVQLSTLPVAVCHGTADNSDDAQAQAAHNALHYLKIMTKK
ncbi:PREDICTED: RISC-loading complex subunit tarbp2-like isoform X2 [Priapulus caudatus]|uniref:RISC-loading complex subunit tarbp2-like isoform X2 n=1 Tax=Priapulus caudatus TaxID=37621 RepID=A0ABM1DW18_PRICU|nr:PREDICTED: RISC-loading complex subunit tarbp2-like isoform X2 [Priapulus caudatus]